MIEVEIWSDVICPFCSIGKKNFEKGLQLFSKPETVKVIWRSFELDPHAKKNQGLSLYQYLASKYGKSLEWAKEMSDGVAAQAARVGLDFQFAKAVPTNTFDAHRLLHMAFAEGKGEAMMESLFHAHFRDGLDVADHEILVERARTVGLEESSVRAMLAGQDFAAAVRADEELAQTFGLGGVPAFVIDRKYLVSGAQAAETFAQAMEKALQDSQ